METKLQLLRNEVAETYRVYDFEWWHQVLMVAGGLSLALLVAAGFLYLATKDDPDPEEDIPQFFCTCSPKCAVHSAEFFKQNRAAKRTHTATLSIAEMKNEGEGR